MNREELLAWLSKLPADCGVWIDEGGLTLVAETGAYLEIGGEPREEDGGDQ